MNAQSNSHLPGAALAAAFTVRRALLVMGLSFALALAYQATAHATLQLVKQNPSDPATFSGKGGYSADGLGQDGTTGGTLQAQVPAGSTVVQAYLYGSYFFDAAPDVSQRTINFDGTNVVLTTLPNSEPGNSDLSTARATVTSQVAAKVGSGGGTTNFAINNDPSDLDGVALVVIFSNPTLPQNTIAVLDGGSKQAGDTATFNFASPIDKSAPGFAATMALGSGFSAQDQSSLGAAGTHTCGVDAPQSSLIDVNGARLTSCAGNFDDGFLNNGALITVGGVGDSTNNPSNPNQRPADGATPRVQDDELYNLVPFMNTGDTKLVVDTSNPSTDDNLFLAVIATTAQAAVTTEICNNGIDDDGDGLVDGQDPDCQAAGCRIHGVGNFAGTFPASNTVIRKADSLSSDKTKPVGPPNSGIAQRLHLAWGPPSNPTQHKFLLTTKLTLADCIDTAGVDPGQGQTFDTFLAEGGGTVDGVPGFKVRIRLTDGGENGSGSGAGKDQVHVRILKTSNGSRVLLAKGTLSSGNQNAQDGA